MKIDKKKITNSKLMTACSHSAMKILDALNKAAPKLDPLAELPLIGGSVEDIRDMISMFNDYAHRRYEKLPVTVFIGGAVIVAYLLMPFDLIPDNIPILGFIDDAFIINTVIELCLEVEIDRYRAWREENYA